MLRCRHLAIAGCVLLICFAGNVAHAELRACNSTKRVLELAIGYKDSKEWVTEGWWLLDPLSCETIIRGALQSRYFYAQAHDYDLGGGWSGRAMMCTRDKEFTIRGAESCKERGYEQTGFFEVDTGDASSWTVKFTTESFVNPANDTFTEGVLVSERLAAEGRFADAAEKLKPLTAHLDPNAAGQSRRFDYASTLLGEMLYKSGRFPEALAAYIDRERRIAPDGYTLTDLSPRTLDYAFRKRLAGLADVHLALGNTEAAEALLRSAFRIMGEIDDGATFAFSSNRHQLLYSTLAYVIAIKGACGEAQKILAPLGDKLPGARNLAPYLTASALCSYRAQDYQAAFRAAKQALQLSWLYQAPSAAWIPSAPGGQEMPHSLLELVLSAALKCGDRQFVAEAFEVAQLAHDTVVGRSLFKMVARLSASQADLAANVRELQDLEEKYARQEAELLAALGLPPVIQNMELIGQGRSRLADLRAKVNKLGGEIRKRDPTYFSLIDVRALPLAEAQKYLLSNEAFEVLLAGEDSIYAWLLTSGDVKFRKLDMDRKRLEENVAALRCGLDARLWDDAADWPETTQEEVQQRAAQLARRRHCAALVGAERMAAPDGLAPIFLPPFDLARAHQLYRALLGPFEDMTRGKQLIIVPSGPLTSLPFSVLVAEPARSGAAGKPVSYRDAAWLGARTPMTTLPSVASLKALREFAKSSRATKPYLGIGNPLLDGPQDDARWGAYYQQAAALARAKRCGAETAPQQIAAARGPRSIGDFGAIFRGSHADIEHVRLWAPLPETADELCEVARRLGVPESEILLGSAATETRLKALSEQGRLADYAIVHFATHGALTGQVRGSAEPGLILTPPASGIRDPQLLDRDDGYLTASEIATLKLDADWVILSACNTAGGAGENAEALSGLARAFTYAGARALLVSHWEVGSAAAVKLTTRAFAELEAKPAVGRAEAFRISMRELIEKGSAEQAHPSMWAPFVIVGEGAAAR